MPLAPGTRLGPNDVTAQIGAGGKGEVPADRRSRREAIVALLLWFLAGAWTISVSYWLGYHQPPRSLGGIPHWVVWGVFTPWIVSFLLHTWFSFFFMRDNGAAARPPSPRDSAGRQS